MRKFLTLPVIALTLVATPALAQQRKPAPDLDHAAAMLRNPAVQDGLTAVVAQLADAFLQTRVGPLAALTDPRADVRPEDTLGDVVRRDDPAFDRRLRDNTRRTLGQAGAALGRAAALSKELEATAARLRAALRGLDARD